MSNYKIIITSPSLDLNQNVSGISSVTRFIIQNNTQAEYIHFELGRKDNERGGIHRMVAIGKAILRWRKLLTQYPDAIVHYNFPLSKASILRDPLFIGIARMKGNRMIIHLHGGNFLTATRIPKYLHTILRKVFSLSVPFIVLSDLEKKLVQEKFGCKQVEVLPNCVDLEEATHFERKTNKEHPLTIGYLGRIAETKGMDYLLEACSRMKANGKRFLLKIAGKEEAQGQYLPLFAEKLGKQFEYAGVVSGESKSQYLKSLDVFVLPSFFEGLPMSLIECMSFGIVPVTTPVGSIGEIVREEENGLFIKVKDCDSITHQIDRLNNDRDLLEQLSIKARNYIFSHFSTDMYINRLNKTYADSSLIGKDKNNKQISKRFFSVVIKASLAIPYLADKLLAVCYKKCMRHCGKEVYLRPLSSDFKGLENLSIGDYTSIPKHSTFYCTEAPLTIGKKVIFGPAPTIITGDHRIDVVGKFIMDSHDKLPENDAPVVIEDDVWCGSHVTILKGVTIGRGSVVAAGAVVTKSCPPYSIIGGVPAKVLKSRFTPEEIARHEQALYS